MRAVNIVLAFAFGSIAQATIPSHFGTLFDKSNQKRALTTDNTCGINGAGTGRNLTCDPNLVDGGSCCSPTGYCGSTTDYCGTGCQSEFGICAVSAGSRADPDSCGLPNDSQKCSNSQCCSVNGWCGNSTDYCGDGCQTEFGRCEPNAPNGRCGPDGGNKQCSNGQCCSAAGYCGTGKDYCSDPDCLWRFGNCDSYLTPAGASTQNDPRPRLGSVSYSEDLYDCIKSNVVALTFDDGPYNYTADILDILKQYGFTATFFITGNNIGKGAIDTQAPYPALIKRMFDEGHQVASHTWSHYNLSDIGTDMRIQQMTKNERAIANIIGKYPTYMRPPFSECSVASGCPADLEKLGYHRTYFDLDTEDYLNPLPSQIQNSKNIVKKFLGIKGIDDYLSIQHDIVEQSVHSLSTYYYDLIKAKGWKGVTVGECVNDPKANWYRTPGGGTSTSKVVTKSTTLSIPTKTSSATTKITTTSLTKTSATSTKPKTSSSSSSTTRRKKQ